LLDSGHGFAFQKHFLLARRVAFRGGLPANFAGQVVCLERFFRFPVCASPFKLLPPGSDISKVETVPLDKIEGEAILRSHSSQSTDYCFVDLVRVDFSVMTVC
jgi:hypothetical protein